jgi:hypothetical protein
MPVSVVKLGLISLPYYDFSKKDSDVGSIVDHIYGYKKIYNYTLITLGDK